MWLCDYHNEINDQLDKELEDCQNVPVLWGKDDCDCEVEDDEFPDIEDEDYGG